MKKRSRRLSDENAGGKGQKKFGHLDITLTVYRTILDSAAL